MSFAPPPPGTTFAGQWDYGQTTREVVAILKLMGMPAVLRRANGGDRWVKVFIRKHNARELMGGLVDPMARMCLVAPDVSPPPDHQQDRLITFVQPLGDVPLEEDNLRIVSQPEPVKPAGVVLLYKMEVRR